MLPILLALPALATLLALIPVRRPFPVAVACWGLSLAAIEVTLHLGLVVIVLTAVALLHGDVTDADLAGAGLAVLICAGLAVVLARHLATARVLDRAFAEAGTGSGSPTTTTTATTPSARTPARHRTPWLRVLVAPWPGRPRDVQARKGLVYGPDATANRLDLYTRNDQDAGSARGVLVHLHGGHFRMGAPSRESRLMLFDHAQRGWAAISATYHLAPTPEAGFPQHLVDIKRLIHWIRVEGPDHGIPTGVPVVLSGSSAGAHLTMMAALTTNDPRFQPGFADADTTLAGAIGLYGYYGPLGPESKAVSDPGRHPATDAPPVVVIHGTSDTYTPVRGSRRLVKHLHAGSSNPVVYAELPGAQHGFDAVRSPRYLAVVDAIARITDTLVDR